MRMPLPTMAKKKCTLQGVSATYHLLSYLSKGKEKELIRVETKFGKCAVWVIIVIVS